MSTDYKLGSVVRSVLGGPEMTVTNPGPLPATPIGGVAGKIIPGRAPSPDLIICKWFEKDELKSKTVNKRELEIISSPEESAFDVNDIVELASGGPRMIVTRVGPTSKGGFSGVIGGRVVHRGGSVRSDLTGCKWLKGSKDFAADVESGALRLVQKR